MHNSKLIQELKQLDPAEFKELGKFLESPFLNSNKGLVRFFEFLKKHHPRFEEKNLAKEEVFKAIYPPGKAFKDNELRALMTDFVKAVETFLSFLELKRDKWQQQKMHVSALGRKGDYQKFEEAIQALIKKLNAGKERDMVYFYELFDLNRRLFFHHLTKKLRADVPSLAQTMTNLDHFFALAKLRLAAEMKGRENPLKEKHTIAFLDEVRRFATVQKEQSPAIGMYLGILQLMDEHQDEVFQQLYDDFIKYSDTLRKEELSEILPFLVNHSSRQAAMGKREHKLINFKLYKTALAMDILVDNGKLGLVYFYNIVIRSAGLGELEWVKNFIRTYQQYLDAPIREEMVAIAEAILKFHQQKYREATLEISRFQFKFPPMQAAAKRLNIQCFFELSQKNKSFEEVLFSSIMAFEKFLYRNTDFSETSILSDRLFCKVTSLLAGATPAKGKNMFSQINEILQQGTSIASRGWLIEKMELMKK